MGVSTGTVVTPVELAEVAPGAWRSFRNGITQFLESVGEILHGMDEARQAHPIISSCRIVRR